jgi:H+/Cl- antiporter ClcA
MVGMRLYYLSLLQFSAKWLVIGSVIGLLAGVSSALFLVVLAWVTQARIANGWLVFFLPLIGLGISWVYQRYGGTAREGSHLIFRAIHHPDGERIPLRMMPLILLGTWFTHLGGGSVGREGVAVQMAVSLSDTLRRLIGQPLRLSVEDRRLMLLAGISGGFGAVFGTPLAGLVFSMEAPSMGRMRYEGLLPCLVSALIGHLVVQALGIQHAHPPPLPHSPLDALLVGKVALAGVAFGLTALLFIELHHAVQRTFTRHISIAWLRPVIGGVCVLGFALLLGSSDYFGLSTALIDNSLGGTGVLPYAFLLKLIFTAFSLGAGFVGGEVTPLFVMGCTLGYTLGPLLGVDPLWMASIGYATVFAGASNTPLACILVGVELFGGGGVLYIAVACVVAYWVSGHRSIYHTQQLETAKVRGP